MSRILRFLAVLVACLFSFNAYADYTCPTYKTYTSCKAGYYLSDEAGADSINSCQACPTGWTSAAGATSINDCYITVNLSKSIKTSSSGTGYSAGGTLATPVKCYYKRGCALPNTNYVLSYSGFYFPGGWESTLNAASKGTALSADGATTTMLLLDSSTTSSPTYYPVTYYRSAVTLNSNGATTAGTSTVYRLGSFGYWKSTTISVANKITVSNATSKVKIATLPVKTGSTFVGYYTTSATTGGTQVFDNNGYWTGATVSNTTLYARWSSNTVTCAKGYYKNASDTCVICNSTYYCPGGTYNKGTTIEGRISCPDPTVYNPNNLCGYNGVDCGSKLGTNPSSDPAKYNLFSWVNSNESVTGADTSSGAWKEEHCIIDWMIWVDPLTKALFGEANADKAQYKCYWDPVARSYSARCHLYRYFQCAKGRYDADASDADGNSDTACEPCPFGSYCDDLSVYITGTCQADWGSDYPETIIDANNIGAREADDCLKTVGTGYYVSAEGKGAYACPMNSYCPNTATVYSGTGSDSYYSGQTTKKSNSCAESTNGNYPYSAGLAGADSVSDCYLTTTPGQGVFQSGSAPTECTGGGVYCPGGIKVYYGSLGGYNYCPSNFTSATSAAKETDCYRGITLNKNGMSGSLTLPSSSGCRSITTNSGTNAATVYAYYNTACKLPTTVLSGTATGTTYTGTGSWATSSNAATGFVSSITLTDTSSTTPVRYAGKKYTCSAGYYLKASTNGACTACSAGNWCEGVSNVYYSSSNQGLSSCPRGYENSAAGAAYKNQCYAMCSAGTLVLEPGTGCQSVPSGYGAWTQAHNVYYGSVSGGNYCATLFDESHEMIERFLALSAASAENMCRVAVAPNHKAQEVIPNVNLLALSLGSDAAIQEIEFYISDGNGGEELVQDPYASGFVSNSDGIDVFYDGKYGAGEEFAEFSDVFIELTDYYPITRIVVHIFDEDMVYAAAELYGINEYGEYIKLSESFPVDIPSASVSSQAYSFPVKYYQQVACSDGYSSAAHMYSQGTTDTACTANTFSISYNGNAGTGTAPTSPTSCTYDQACTAPANPYTRTGYSFAGWKCTGGTTACDGDIIAAGGSLKNVSTGSAITLTAQWTANCNAITLDQNGGTGGAVGPLYKKTGSTVWYTDANCSASTTKITIPTLSKSVFTGYKNASGTQCIAADGTLSTSATCNVTGAATLTAQYSACTCTNGTNVSACSVTGTNTSNQCTYSYTCNTGYHTSGTFNGTTATAANTSPSCSANKYTVVFNSNKPSTASTTMSGSMSNQSFDYDTAQNLTANAFSLPGYDFAGWATSASGSVVHTDKKSVSNLTTTNNDTVNLYAKWTAKTYTVSFDANGGNRSGPPYITVTFDQGYTSSPVGASRTGYTFEGWYTAASGGSLVFDTAGNLTTETVSGYTSGGKWVGLEDKTLYAHWALDTYTITYYDGSTKITTLSPTSYDVTTSTITLPTYFKAGENFVAWHLDSASGTVTTQIAKGSTGNKVFYAEMEACPAGAVCNGTSIESCPVGYPNSDEGSESRNQCYANITLDKNGYSGRLTGGAGCSVSGTTGTTADTLKLYYDTQCTLPTTSLTQAGYTATTSWATSNTIGATSVATIAASTSAPSFTTYFARKPSCAANYYKKNTTTCSTCSSLTSGGFYDTSMANNNTDASVCSGTLDASEYIATKNADPVTCLAGMECAGGDVIKYGLTGGGEVCGDNEWSDAGASACSQCEIGKGYGNSGDDAANHATSASCITTCLDGEYVAIANAACTTVGAGYYGPGGDVSYGNISANRAQCPANLTTIGYGVGANEAGDCGRVMNIGGGKLYLRSDRKTAPSFNVTIGSTTYYGNMSPVDKKISDGATKSLKVDVGGTKYSVYDDSVN